MFWNAGLLDRRSIIETLEFPLSEVDGVGSKVGADYVACLLMGDGGLSFLWNCTARQLDKLKIR